MPVRAPTMNANMHIKFDGARWHGQHGRDGRENMRRFSGFLIALAVSAVLAVVATTPPLPRMADAPADAFSAVRAMEDIRAIAARPHPTGTSENVAVRAHIARRMAELGMAVSTSEGVVSAKGTEKRNKWSGRNDPPMVLTNVIGTLHGKNPNLPAILLMAHHDSVWGSPGAADDGAGVAASLEVVRAIKQQGQPQRDLIVLITDAEELGLEGAKHFFANDPMRLHVGAVINMEARGGGGRTTLFQTSRQNGNAVRLYASSVEGPGASSLSAFIYSVLPNDTDLTPVIRGDYVAYNFAFIGRPGLYHSPLATPERLDEGALQDMGTQVLDLTHALLNSPTLPAKAADVVFFDLFGWLTVTYPAWLGWLMLAVAAVGFGFVMKRERSEGLASGAGRIAALLVLSAFVLYLLNLLSLGFGPSNYYDRLAAIPRLEIIAGLASGAIFLAIMGGWRAGLGGTVGCALPLLLLAVAAQALAPTAAYVLVLPLMLVALALAVRHNALIIGVAALVTGYMLALGHQLMQGVGPTMPMASALPLAIASLSIVPVWPGLNTAMARKLAAGLLVGAAVIALWVQLDAPAASIAVYSDTKK